MGNTVSISVLSGVRFLRDTCLNCPDEDYTVELSPPSSSDSPSPPEAAHPLIRNCVLRRALRRPSKGIRKNNSEQQFDYYLDNERLLVKVRILLKIMINFRL